jgi:hypothetical protein
MALLLVLLLSCLAFNVNAWKNKTLNISLEFSPCNCDLTALECDAYCCCDKDCNIADISGSTPVDIWQLNRECKNDGANRDIFYATDCFNKTNQESTEDLKYGLVILRNVLQSFLCIVFTRESIPYPFVQKMVEVENQEEFDLFASQSIINKPDNSLTTSSQENITYGINDPIRIPSGEIFMLP